MTTSQRGIDFIKGYEKLRLKAYRCAAGKWTIGWGSTWDVDANTVITLADAERRFQEDLGNAECEVARIAGDNMSQGQWDALVSVAFNGGPGMLRQVLKDGLPAAGDRLPMFCHAHVNGKAVKLAGLEKRRLGEQEMFLA